MQPLNPLQVPLPFNLRDLEFGLQTVQLPAELGNRPLSDQDKAHNKKLSKVRARVEHIFGFQTNSMNGGRLRTLDWERGCFQIGMGNLVYNLFRAGQLGASVG